MKLSKSAEKLKNYYQRLEEGKVKKINAKHVERVLRKLHSRRDSLAAELKSAKKSDMRQQLIGKISVVASQIGRTEWLISQLIEHRKDH